MTYPYRNAEAGALAVLELLAFGAPSERLEQLLIQDRGAEPGEPGQRAEAAGRAVSLGLAIQSHLARRRQSEARMSALLAGARDLVAADLDGVLEVVVRRTRLLFGFDLVYLGVAEEGTGAQVIGVADGHTSELTLGLRLPTDAGLNSVLDRRGTPFWTGDYLTERRFAHNERLDEVARRENMHAIVAVPLALDRTPSATLFGAYRHTRSFPAEEIAAMIAWSEVAVAAIDKAGGAVEKSVSPRERPDVLGAEQSGDVPSTQVAHCFQAALAQDEAALGEYARELLGGALTGYDLDGLPVLFGQQSGPDTSARRRAPPDPLWAARIHATSVDPALGGRPAADGSRLASIRAGDELLGTLVLHPGPTAPADPGPLLDLVALASAVLLLRRREPLPLEAVDTRERFLDDLLATPPRAPRTLERRASAFGIEPQGPLTVLVAHLGAVDADARERAENRAFALAQRDGGLCTAAEDGLVLLLPTQDASAAAERLYTELSRAVSARVCVGTAEPVRDLGAVAAAHQEASRCAQALVALGAGGHGGARDLGFVGLLLAGRRDAESFVDATLGPVLAYDRSSTGNLRGTLDAYFAAGGSPTRAAGELHVHPNTIARRLERVSTLIGPDWQRPDRALEIQLALRLLRLRAAVTTAGPG